jgi:hypothetical protein
MLTDRALELCEAALATGTTLKVLVDRGALRYLIDNRQRIIETKDQIIAEFHVTEKALREAWTTIEELREASRSGVVG